MGINEHISKATDANQKGSVSDHGVSDQTQSFDTPSNKMSLDKGLSSGPREPFSQSATGLSGALLPPSDEVLSRLRLPWETRPSPAHKDAAHETTDDKGNSTTEWQAVSASPTTADSGTGRPRPPATVQTYGKELANEPVTRKARRISPALTSDEIFDDPKTKEDKENGGKIYIDFQKVRGLRDRTVFSPDTSEDKIRAAYAFAEKHEVLKILIDIGVHLYNSREIPPVLLSNKLLSTRQARLGNKSAIDLLREALEEEQIQEQREREMSRRPSSYFEKTQASGATNNPDNEDAASRNKAREKYSAEDSGQSAPQLATGGAGRGGRENDSRPRRAADSPPPEKPGDGTREYGEILTSANRETREGTLLKNEIPLEVQWAGRLFSNARLEKGITLEKIAERTGLSVDKIREFEEGKLYIDLNQIYRVAGETSNLQSLIDPENPKMKVLDKIRWHQNWLYILSQPGMSIDRVTLLFRLSMGDTLEEFARREEALVVSTLENIEMFGRLPRGKTAELILSAVGFDAQSKVIRLYHLLRNKVSPLDVDTFKRAASKDQISYYLASTGTSEESEASEIYSSSSSIHRFKDGTRGMSEDLLARMLSTQGDRNNIVHLVMLKRLQGKRVKLSSEDRFLLLNSSLVFTENFNIPPYQLTDVETELDPQLRSLDKIGAIFRFFINHPVKVSQRQVVAKGGGNRTTLGDVMNNGITPEDSTVIRFMGALGYEFYHPFTQYALHINYEERKRRNLNRKK